MSRRAALAVFLKYPEAGRVKTRLAASIGDAAALEVYATCVAETLRKVARLGDQADAILFCAPDDRAADLEAAYAHGWVVRPQGPGDLGDRLRRALFGLWEDGYDSVLFLGGDCPTVPDGCLAEALEASRRGLCAGPASDGGYWCLGLNAPEARLFEGIEWGTSRVLEQTRERAAEAGHRLALLPAWYDIDTVADLRRASECPEGGAFRRFADLARRTAGEECPGS